MGHTFTDHWCESWDSFCYLLGRPLLVLRMFEELWCKGSLYLCWHYSHFFGICWIFGVDEKILHRGAGMGCGWRVCGGPFMLGFCSQKNMSGLLMSAKFPALLIVVVGKLATRYPKCCLVQDLSSFSCPSCCRYGGFHGWLACFLLLVLSLLSDWRGRHSAPKSRSFRKLNAAFHHNYFSYESISLC